MKEAFVKAFESLKGNFSDSEHPKEYVLIPADDMIEIATDNIAKRKSLSEVIDILNLHPPKKKTIKIKRTELELFIAHLYNSNHFAAKRLSCASLIYSIKVLAFM